MDSKAVQTKRKGKKKKEKEKREVTECTVHRWCEVQRCREEGGWK